MTNSSAMTLVLLVFLALLVGALIIVVVGGGLSEHARARKLRTHDDMDHRQRAA